VLEETSRGDFRLVEIQVKVEICSVMTCFFNKSYRGPPKPLWHFTCADLCFFLPHAYISHLLRPSRSFEINGHLLVEATPSGH
jgi:hypothetical protein